MKYKPLIRVKLAFSKVPKLVNLWLFLLFFIFLFTIIQTHQMVDEPWDSLCSGNINEVESEYCTGMEGRGHFQYIARDLTIQPTILLYPSLFRKYYPEGQLYWNVSLPNLLLWPVYSVEIYTTVPEHAIYKPVLEILFWLNLLYLGVLAFLLAKLWEKRRIWKLIVIIFFATKQFYFNIFFFILVLVALFRS